jgi:hypothetical protein
MQKASSMRRKIESDIKYDSYEVIEAICDTSDIVDDELAAFASV